MKRPSASTPPHPLVIGVLLVWGMVSSSLAAQEPAHLSSLEVAIWPEYDRPDALVMLRGELAPDVALPATVTFSIPAAAGQPHAVAVKDMEGRLLNANYRTEPVGDWLLVHVTTEVPAVRLEYYLPIDRSGSGRKLTFSWPGGLDLDRVAYEVQQPAGAQSLLIEPAPRPGEPGADGLTYFFAELGAKRLDETFAIELAYSKASDALSVASLPPAPAPAQVAPLSPAASPAPATGGARPDSGSALSVPLIVGLLIAGAVVGGAVGYFGRRR